MPLASRRSPHAPLFFCSPLSAAALAVLSVTPAIAQEATPLHGTASRDKSSNAVY
ncbi:MAG: hypothetical protein ACTH5D_00955 [Halomonas sp.]|uniref:hypothetical protein n=1 Tax=Halomonas sp. TaxID=1486246 RepID=UPI003F932742